MTKLETVDPHYGRLTVLAEARLIDNALARNGLRITFSPPSDPAVSVVIVSRNASDVLVLMLYRLACLQAFAGCTFEVILIDNASDECTQALLDRLDGIRLIRNPTNLGFGPGCNAGAKVARGRYLLFLNPDVELMPGAIGALIAPFADATVGIVGAHLVFPGGYLQECGAFFRNDAQVTHAYGRGNTDPLLPEGAFQRDVGYVSGAVLCVERAFFDELGGFDDLFTPAYFEDTDLCVRCLQAGRRVVYQPLASAIHFENATTPVRSEVETLIDRHRARFLDRHQSWLFPQGGSSPRFGDRSFNQWALRVLYIDDAVPHVDLGAGMPRSNFIVKTMAQFGYIVTIYPVYRCDADLAQRYRDLPNTVEILEAEDGAGLARIIDERREHYDVVWVSRPHNIDLFCQIIQDKGLSVRNFVGKRLIFDAEALFSLRDFLETALRDGQACATQLAVQARRETRNFVQADHVICVSDAEASLVRSYGVSNVVTLGHAFEPCARGYSAFEERRGFLFIGLLDEERSPNVDALTWFLDAVWPAVRRAIADAELVVIGKITPEIRQQLNAPGVKVLGQIIDPNPHFDRARVCIAPTRFAAGIPHKVHAAVAQGLPCMITPILAEQVGWEPGSGILVRDWRDPEAFAAGLIGMHDDRDSWTALQREGIAQVASHCAPAAFTESVKRLCEAPDFA